jgi:hypothetical protein
MPGKWLEKFQSEPEVSRIETPITPVDHHQAEDLNNFTDTELSESAARLESLDVLMSVEPDGAIHLVQRAEAMMHAGHGAAVYTPTEMLLYVRLSADERRMVRSLKTIRQRAAR